MNSEIAARIDRLCLAVAEAEQRSGGETEWPQCQLDQCREHGFFGWFAPRNLGGDGWSELHLLQAYLQLAKVSLTTAFVLTQRAAAVDRMLRFGSQTLRERVVPGLMRGDLFATVGISQLTTSRQHWRRPAVLATIDEGQIVLSGQSPWVTGAVRADWLVVGGATETQQHVLAAVETTAPGVDIHPPVALTGLTGSLTGPVSFNHVVVPADQVLARPDKEGSAPGDGGRTGGLPTSALALGHARRAIEYLREEAHDRNELAAVAAGLEHDYDRGVALLLAAAGGNAEADNESVRRHANDLVLRATQAAMAAAKGAGYLASHPVSRWCREALFFLVWSCPQRVVLENMRRWSTPAGSDCPV